MGVNGFTGYGNIEYAIWADGEKSLNIALKGIAGRKAEIYADDIYIATVAVKDGRSKEKLRTKKGATIEPINVDAQIFVLQNDEPILTGRFAKA